MDLVSAESQDIVLPDFTGEGGLQEPAADAEPRRLIDLYESEFRVVAVNSAARRRAAHRLRYQVYCLENAFENPDHHPDGLEHDEYDAHSVQSLLQRRSDGASIGTVRLILPVAERRGDCLPFHRLCRPIVPLLDLLLPIDTMAEVSRFCISKELRRRPAGKLSGRSPVHPSDRLAALTRHATLGLIRSLIEHSIGHGITHWCLVVEPALLRFLASLGLQFHALGPLVEHHGLRQPCHADLATLIDGVRQRRPDVWEVITDDGRLAPAVTGRFEPGQVIGAGTARPDLIPALEMAEADRAEADLAVA